MTLSPPQIRIREIPLEYFSKSEQKYVLFGDESYINTQGKEYEIIVKFAACQRFIACGTLSSRVLVYFYGERRPKLDIDLTNYRITGLSFNSDFTILFVSSLMKKIAIIDLTNFEIIFKYTHIDKIHGSVIDPNSRGGVSYSWAFFVGDLNQPDGQQLLLMKDGLLEEISKESYIEMIAYNGEIIAWATIKEFNVLNLKTGEKINFNGKLCHEVFHNEFNFSENNDFLTVLFQGNLFKVSFIPKLSLISLNPQQDKSLLCYIEKKNFDLKLFKQENSPCPKIEVKLGNVVIEDEIPFHDFTLCYPFCLQNVNNNTVLAAFHLKVFEISIEK